MIMLIKEVNITSLLKTGILKDFITYTQRYRFWVIGAPCLWPVSEHDSILCPAPFLCRPLFCRILMGFILKNLLRSTPHASMMSFSWSILEIVILSFMVNPLEAKRLWRYSRSCTPASSDTEDHLLDAEGERRVTPIERALCNPDV